MITAPIRPRLLLALPAAVILCLPASSAQDLPFDSGSDESYGPLDITANTSLDLPPDGVFHCTTVNVAEGATLRFNRNAANTPVYILATGDITINGTVNISAPAPIDAGGLPGPGGYRGGARGTDGVVGGDGHGPGGGGGLAGNFGSGGGTYRTQPSLNNTLNGNTWGDPLLMVPVGGAGAGGTWLAGGGGGGGGILLASESRVAVASTGSIRAVGGPGAGPNLLVANYHYSRSAAGSGGAIRICAPIVAGDGLLSVEGGSFTSRSARVSGNGRIRIDTLDATALNLSYGPNSSPSVGANMIARLDPAPSLRIVEVVTSVKTYQIEGSDPVVLILPSDTDPAVTVRVEAQGFGAMVPIVLYATPDHGTRSRYAAVIDNTSDEIGNTDVAEVEVTLPVNERVTLQVFAGAGTNLP